MPGRVTTHAATCRNPASHLALTTREQKGGQKINDIRSIVFVVQQDVVLVEQELGVGVKILALIRICQALSVVLCIEGDNLKVSLLTA